MQSSELMFAIAQIAVGLAGFSAIIVSLNAKPIRDWDDADQYSLRILIYAAIVVVFFSLIPSLLVISLEPHKVWLYGLWAYGLVHIADLSGQERTGEEYRILLEAAGFEISRIIPTDSEVSVIETVPV